MRKNQVTLKCQNCGNNYQVKASKASTSKFCSKFCMEDKNGGLSGRFWRQVNKNGPVPDHRPELGRCWVWFGGKASGYGTMLGADKKSIVRTHRVSWELHNGPIPGNLWVLHACDNRACVNPSHLFLGTVQDNVKDMDKKGRRKTRVLRGEEHPAKTHPDYFARGEHNPMSKLTEAQVKKIRQEHPTGPQLIKMAEDLGVSVETIYMARRRATWRHLP